jgi:hypothetical protein
MTTMQCSKCGKTDIDCPTLHKRHLWLLVVAFPLLVISGYLIAGYIFYPTVRETGSLLAVCLPAIIGFSVLGYAVQSKQVFNYECKDCGHSWRRSAKTGPMEEDPRHIDWQIQRLAHDSDKERNQAAQWLGERRIDSAVEPLITCLEDKKIKYEDARKSAAIALAQIGDVRAIESLTKTAMDDSWKYSDVRVSAISALGEFDDPRVHETLETILGEKDILVRQAAEGALAKVNPNVA